MIALLNWLVGRLVIPGWLGTERHSTRNNFNSTDVSTLLLHFKFNIKCGFHSITKMCL